MRQLMTESEARLTAAQINDEARRAGANRFARIVGDLGGNGAIAGYSLTVTDPRIPGSATRIFSKEDAAENV